MVNSQPVGFITAIGTHIDLLFVSPDRARCGIGGALIEALCSPVSSANPDGGRQHYRKPCFTAHGFKVVAEQRWRRAGSGLLITGWKRVALR
ncbi:GNAT family N-acetyltransferase [Klebsiella pneumoniae]|nr:GNAT family N-acetyltransferase [Klebsiella pneumoniae]